VHIAQAAIKKIVIGFNVDAPDDPKRIKPGSCSNMQKRLILMASRFEPSTLRDKDVTDRIIIEQALEVFRQKVRN
jgi:hypothetical protein